MQRQGIFYFIYQFIHIGGISHGLHQQYTDAGRPELAENELAEAAAMEVYLPKQLSEAEVEAELVKIIAEVGATQPSDMGKVMGVATKRLAGLAEGRLISALVKKLLAQ